MSIVICLVYVQNIIFKITFNKRKLSIATNTKGKENATDKAGMFYASA